MAAPSLALLRIMAAEPDRRWTLLQLVAASELSQDELSPLLQWLRLAKLIGRNPRQIYTITDAGAALVAISPTEPKVTKTDLRSMVWRALRMQRKASVTELLDVIGQPATDTTRRQVRAYLTKLCGTDLLGISRFKTRTGERLYQLLRDPGPLAPVVTNKGHVIDPNNGGLPLPLAEVAHAA
ncbi:hypothetical protein [Niveispirillum sp. KHB5.9]|uniref:hypothetical protein n=1 Tax=Niveispirillum sp. KHB5.9 TaxID=3400269 RepID=UPI003A85F985